MSSTADGDTAPPGGARSDDFAFTDVTPLLAPRSVVVVGASERPGNLGGTAVGYLQRFGFPGEIWAVNPRAQPVFGAPCAATISDLPELEHPTLAILAVSAPATIRLVDECASAGIRHGVIWSGGFAEMGAEGAKLQDQLVASCQRAGFTVAGPNCLGLITTHVPLTATFSSFLSRRNHVPSGGLSIIAQSGGVGTILQSRAAEQGYGFRAFISTGNEAVVSAGDYVHQLASDPGTKVMALYLEGLRDGPKLLAALDAARAMDKHVVVLKAGLNAATARAAAAHTGALVGEDRVWSAVLAEHGALKVDTLDQLLDTALYLCDTPARKLPRGSRVGILTFGGGLGVLAADGCALHDLTVPVLTDNTRQRLAELVPPTASTSNPVDLTPAAFSEPYIDRLADVIGIIADDPNLDIVHIQYGATWLDGKSMADAARAARDATDKAVVVVWPSAPPGALAHLRAQGVFVFEEYSRAAAVLGGIAAARTTPSVGDRPAPMEFNWDTRVPSPKAGTLVPEHRCSELLRAAGLDVAAGRLARTVSEAGSIAGDLGFPVVMKAISPALTHRASAGLVALRITNESEAQDAFLALQQRASGLGISLEGIYVQTMVAGDVELLVSASRDPIFGTVVSVGSGGTLTESIDDVALTLAPVNPEDAATLLGRTQVGRRAGFPQVGGGHPAAQFVATFSSLAASGPWDRFILEINPVKLNGERATAIDALLEIKEP